MEELRLGFNHMKHKFGQHSKSNYMYVKQFVGLLMIPLQAMWVHMPHHGILQCGKPLFIVRITILNGMLEIVCLGHVKIVGLII
jgi:hypothetical protein